MKFMHQNHSSATSLDVVDSSVTSLDVVDSIRTGLFLEYLFIYIPDTILLSTRGRVGTKRTLSLSHWNVTMFSPWYSREIAHLALNNNHSLTTQIYSSNYLPINVVDVLWSLLQNNIYSFSPTAACLTEKQQIHHSICLWFDLTGTRTYDLPHLRRAR
jgi:hypothetical protein